MGNGWKESKPKLNVPTNPYAKNNEVGHYELKTFESKLIADYCNIPLFEVYELNIFEYWFLLREAAINGYYQTEEGRKYLNNCWRMEQTKCVDADALINFGKGGE